MLDLHSLFNTANNYWSDEDGLNGIQRVTSVIPGHAQCSTNRELVIIWVDYKLLDDLCIKSILDIALAKCQQATIQSKY